jgi:hypothetical protein
VNHGVREELILNFDHVWSVKMDNEPRQAYKDPEKGGQEVIGYDKTSMRQWTVDLIRSEIDGNPPPPKPGSVAKPPSRQQMRREDSNIDHCHFYLSARLILISMIFPWYCFSKVNLLQLSRVKYRPSSDCNMGRGIMYFRYLQKSIGTLCRRASWSHHRDNFVAHWTLGTNIHQLLEQVLDRCSGG